MVEITFNSNQFVRGNSKLVVSKKKKKKKINMKEKKKKKIINNFYSHMQAATLIIMTFQSNSFASYVRMKHQGHHKLGLLYPLVGVTLSW